MLKKWLKFFKQNNIKIKLDVIKEAIIDYRSDGKELMRKLAEKYGLDIENEKDYEKLITKNNEEIPRNGELSKRWNYAFHGCECGFYNKKNKQQVEVVLSNQPEFGHIDSWFLLSYMETTEKYKKEIEGINWQQLEPLIEKLYKTGEIESIDE
ncbi:DUF6896 domain-containing protein [Chryseobacterium indoltheticum]|uniref:DUF6896 domain-containing protein n=1 Tax=Chryseobacterium indoltheticum TaxID=254 RepID=A0A381F551_9FLAO|nr:hypothetical protein [Chryseobacterium indoltheticum]AZA75127.1 hypothetical protein EG358_15730 [Chryseobacterium indoltheticum]SIQ54531.1 hypothetical protein SAMN05421682_10642 [Chryseobacterium indoltheticum]SUX41598.1 Uncharacterised protein [Chryseobacterium indoltheticum]